MSRVSKRANTKTTKAQLERKKAHREEWRRGELRRQKAKFDESNKHPMP